MSITDEEARKRARIKYELDNEGLTGVVIDQGAEVVPASIIGHWVAAWVCVLGEDKATDQAGRSG